MNRAAETGKNYTIDVSEGAFVIAYPNKDKQTELEFKYWVESYDKNIFELAIEFNFDGP
jgi:hypothetical protein